MEKLDIWVGDNLAALSADPNLRKAFLQDTPARNLEARKDQELY